MKKALGKATALFAALAFVGCSAGMTTDEQDNNSSAVPGTGNVEFDLEIPNGESISTIDMHLSCAGIEQDHVLDVVDGEVVAAFGGLTPGQCTVTMHSQTPEGTDCEGSQDFVVIEDQTSLVTVVLYCQGLADGGAGSAKITTELELKQCDTDRIRKIYAIPANVLTGASTSIQVETWPGTVVGSPTFSFASLEDDDTAHGTLSSAPACAAGSDACQDFSCDSLGLNPGVDPITNLPTSSVWIEVTLEDEDCYDVERVWVDCLQASVCGDGNTEGAEQCDPADAASFGAGEACDPVTCQLLYCGDGAINVGGEECDGTDGVGANEECSASCVLEFCGDDIVNVAGEACDGTATPANQTCDAACQIVPECGNGIREGAEECDDSDPSLPLGQACVAAGQPNECTIENVAAPNLCLDCLSDPVNGADALVADCLSDTSQAGCGDLLLCLTTNDCYYPLASDCYCGDGADPNACEAPSFVATGDCKDEMLAVSGATNNSDALSFVYTAMQLMSYGANIACTTDCQL